MPDLDLAAWCLSALAIVMVYLLMVGVVLVTWDVLYAMLLLWLDAPGPRRWHRVVVLSVAGLLTGVVLWLT